MLVVGDLFESAAPHPEAEEVVYRHLLAPGEHRGRGRRGGRQPRQPAGWPPSRRCSSWGRCTWSPSRAVPTRAASARLTVGDGEQLNLALLPFVSKRGVVKAADLAWPTPRPDGPLCRALAAGRRGTGRGVHRGRGQRHGGPLHGHRRNARRGRAVGSHGVRVRHQRHRLSHQRSLRGARPPPPSSRSRPCPIWYSGSPLQLDFGETQDDTAVLVVDVEADSPAEVRRSRSAGRRLRTLRGSLDQLRALANDVKDEYVKVVVEEVAPPGLADEVREVLPDAVDIELPPARRRRSPGRTLPRRSQPHGAPAGLPGRTGCRRRSGDPAVRRAPRRGHRCGLSGSSSKGSPPFVSPPKWTSRGPICSPSPAPPARARPA